MAGVVAAAGLSSAGVFAGRLRDDIAMMEWPEESEIERSGPPLVRASVLFFCSLLLAAYCVAFFWITVPRSNQE